MQKQIELRTIRARKAAVEAAYASWLEQERGYTEQQAHEFIRRRWHSGYDGRIEAVPVEWVEPSAEENP